MSEDEYAVDNEQQRTKYKVTKRGRDQDSAAVMKTAAAFGNKANEYYD